MGGRVRKGVVPALAGAILAVLGLSFGITGAAFSTSTGHLFSGIFGGLAMALGLVLSAFGIRAIRAKGVREWLLRHGQRIQVTPSYVGPDPTTTVNAKHPFIVRAAFRDPSTGRLYVATSDCVWEDPKPALMRDPYVTVLFDPRKPKRCMVEL
jgi:hypothetical protein